MSDAEDPEARQRQTLILGDSSVELDELLFVIETASELLAITGEDGHFRLLNKAWEYALGYSRDELRARPFIEFVHPDDRGKTDITTDRMQSGVDLVSFQNRYLAKDGREVPLRWQGVFSSGKRRYYTATKNMTATLQAREQIALLDAICELSAPTIIVQSVAGLITRWDGAGPSMFGWQAHEIEGRPIADLLARDGKPIDLLALLDVDSDSGSDEFELARGFRHRDGTMCDVRVSAREFGDGSSPTTGAVALITRGDRADAGESS
ncbi:MAG: PAS domain S-box protein [Myxococcales bacterium]|nr:PAS domain S-box protein [Myxococcales bacterium]